MNPFGYLNSINTSKKDIMIDDLAEKDYNSFLVNRSLSYFYDTIGVANVMNRYHHIDILFSPFYFHSYDLIFFLSPYISLSLFT